MQFYRFDKNAGKTITHFDSNFIMTRIMRTDKATQIGCMHLDNNGIVGYHEAVVPQLLLVVSGEGWVRSESEDRINVTAGDAVFWDKGEGHETGTDSGLTAIVIESVTLNPSEFLPKRK